MLCYVSKVKVWGTLKSPTKERKGWRNNVWVIFLGILFLGMSGSSLSSLSYTPVKMFGQFWSVWFKMALAEVGVTLP